MSNKRNKNIKTKKTESFLCSYIKILLLQKYKLGLLIRQLRSESTQFAAKVIKTLAEQNPTLFFCILAEYKKEEMPLKQNESNTKFLT